MQNGRIVLINVFASFATHLNGQNTIVVVARFPRSTMLAVSYAFSQMWMNSCQLQPLAGDEWSCERWKSPIVRWWACYPKSLTGNAISGTFTNCYHKSITSNLRLLYGNGTCISWWAFITIIKCTKQHIYLWHKWWIIVA